MIDLQKYEIWFVTGSQHLYGLETLEKVAEHSREMAGVECLRIDADTKVETFKKELRWNEAYYALKRGIYVHTILNRWVRTALPAPHNKGYMGCLYHLNYPVHLIRRCAPPSRSEEEPPPFWVGAIKEKAVVGS